MRAARTALHLPALPQLRTKEPTRKTMSARRPDCAVWLGAAFLAGYLPGIWLGRDGATALGQQLAAWYTESPEGTAFAAAFGARFAVGALQLCAVLLCGFCIWGIGLLAPIDGDRLDLSGAMLGATSGSRLTADGTLHIEPRKYYTVYADGKDFYLGRHRLLDVVTSDGIPLAAVTLVSANAFRSYERGVQFAWFLGSLLFLLAMLAVSAVLSRHFVKPINESLAAVRGGTTALVASGIPEIDELLAMIRARPVGALPPDVEARLCGFAERAGTLTGMERTILQYYMDGYTVKDIPELARISANTVKTHNRNLYRKLGVDSFDELKVYIELFAACGRSGELLNQKQE